MGAEREHGDSSASLIGDAGWLPPTPGRGATLGTFVGVFRPTLLTIIGLVMYLRQGWVVGNAGLLGGLAILGLTFAITGATALSFSAITTNIRIGAGGAFALVSRSLGLEAGGAIGIPLFLAQSLSVAFYMYGFAEGWLYLFPDHERAWVLWGVFAGGFGLSLISEKLALRSQSIVMLGVVVALASIWGGLWTAPELHRPELIGDFADGDFWELFAVYFPAGTGIMVGASLTGKLREPRRSIPRGILGAWAVALAVYLLTFLWYAAVATPAELRGDPLVSIHRAAWSPGVLIGLMSSCFSAMLGSVVAAPNVLAALASHRLVPFADRIARQSRSGTARVAVLVSGAIVALAILLGDLNRVAGMITMFFLITYATINLVVLVEQRLKLISFRPTLRVPKVVPLFGAAASVFAMVVTNPAFGLIALAVVVGLYLFFSRRNLDTPWETVRSGLVTAIADWVAKASQRISGPQYRAWKPDVLMPVVAGECLSPACMLLRDVVCPRGSVQILGVFAGGAARQPPPGIAELLAGLHRADLLARYAPIEAPGLLPAIRAALSVLAGAFYRPNVLFIDGSGRTEEEIQELLRLARRQDIGFVLLLPPEGGPAPAIQAINLWVRDQSPNWRLGLQLANLDLALLLGHQLQRNSGGRLRLISVIADAENLPAARHYLRRMRDEARLDASTEIVVEEGNFAALQARAPAAEVSILGIPETIDLAALTAIQRGIGSTCLFVHDSSLESALA
ncbi:MAG: Na-K-Cl cotransporter [Myxococcales bacterium]|nr:Na-K-Cl cotransporter [Myxococcales bacterium]